MPLCAPSVACRHCEPSMEKGAPKTLNVGVTDENGGGGEGMIASSSSSR